MPETPALEAILDATASDLLPKEDPMLDREEEESPPAVSRKREADDMDQDAEDEPDFGGGIGDLAEEIVPVQYATDHISRMHECSSSLQPPKGVASIAHARIAVPGTSWDRCSVCRAGPRSSRFKVSSQKQRKK